MSATAEAGAVEGRACSRAGRRCRWARAAARWPREAAWRAAPSDAARAASASAFHPSICATCVQGGCEVGPSGPGQARLGRRIGQVLRAGVLQPERRAAQRAARRADQRGKCTSHWRIAHTGTYRDTGSLFETAGGARRSSHSCTKSVPSAVFRQSRTENEMRPERERERASLQLASGLVRSASRRCRRATPRGAPSLRQQHCAFGFVTGTQAPTQAAAQTTSSTANHLDLTSPPVWTFPLGPRMRLVQLTYRVQLR